MKKLSYARILAAALTVGGFFPQFLLQFRQKQMITNFFPESMMKQMFSQMTMIAALLDRLDSISNEYDFDVAIVTVNSTDGEDITYFSDAF
ncbi:MAG: TPM domain-containing protein, partial [Blautia sp.]